MDLKLRNLRAVVTGASTGIGKETARFLAAEGAQVIAVARRTPLLEQLQQEIQYLGGSCQVYSTDLSIQTNVSDMVAFLQQQGGCDILVNNAGGSRPMSWQAPEQDWEEAFAVNWHAVRRLTHGVLPGMIERGHGRVICVTGTAEPSSLNAANAAKAAVHAWAKGLSRDIAKQGITINCVQPGRIHSEQLDFPRYELYKETGQQEWISKNIPMGRMGDPIDMARIIAFLASPDSAYITGERFYVDGGLHRSA
jgi:3-oxoacyl-[acyl-carrier protein] reductase